MSAGAGLDDFDVKSQLPLPLVKVVDCSATRFSFLLAFFLGRVDFSVERSVPPVDDVRVDAPPIFRLRNWMVLAHCFCTSFFDAIWKRNIAKPWRVFRIAKMYWKARVASSIIGMPTSHVTPSRTVRQRAALVVAPGLLPLCKYRRDLRSVLCSLYMHRRRRTMFVSIIAQSGAKKA